LNRPIADRRRAFLENLQVAVLLIDADGSPKFVGRLAQKWFGNGTSTAATHEEGLLT
jgi:hypothetical protein